MYYRINGAPFTIKSAEEKQDLINAINMDSNFSKHLVCRGLNAEQFTGKVTGVVVGEKGNPNKVYIFTCEGNFPTLKLYQRSSAVIYIIELPVSETGQSIIEKPVHTKENKEKSIIEKPSKQSEEKHKDKNSIIVKNTDVKEDIESTKSVVSADIEEVDPFTNPFFVDNETTTVEKQEELNVNPVEEHTEEVKEKPKKRSRKKKS